jgi:site-specific DNA recombinase
MKRKSKEYIKSKRVVAYGYVRVSTEEQKIKGISPEMQINSIRKFSKNFGFELKEILVDSGFSGTNLKRPELKRLIDILENDEGLQIIVWKLDRLFRNTLKLLSMAEKYFYDKNHTLHSLTENIDTKTADGKYFLANMAAMAQRERDLTSERIKAILEYKREKGCYLGGVPYGFKIIGEKGKKKIIPDEKELLLIRKIKRLRSEGKTFQEISDFLNKKKIPTKKNTAVWHPSTIYYILKR